MSNAEPSQIWVSAASLPTVDRRERLGGGGPSGGSRSSTSRVRSDPDASGPEGEAEPRGRTTQEHAHVRKLQLQKASGGKENDGTEK